MKKFGLFILLALVVIVALQSLVILAAPEIITDTTMTTATNDGTVTVEEYAGCTEGLNAGFGGFIGPNSQLCLDSSDAGALNIGLIKGGGELNNAVVIYIDSIEGGFGSTANFTDTLDGLRKAISGLDGENRSTLTFATGFTADFAIAFESTFGGLWAVKENGEHTFVKSVNLTPLNNSTSNTYELDLSLSDLGLSAGGSFKYVATFISTTAYRSNEFHGVAGPITGPEGGGNFGWTPATLATGDYNTFNSYSSTTTPTPTDTSTSTPIPSTATPTETPAPAFDAQITVCTDMGNGTHDMTFTIGNEPVGTTKLIFTHSGGNYVNDYTIGQGVITTNDNTASLPILSVAAADGSFTVLATDTDLGILLPCTGVGTPTSTPTNTPAPAVELLNNGGMETDADANKIPDDWTGKNLLGDKLKCDDVTKVHTGSCAFQFKGGVAENTQLVQNTDLTSLVLVAGQNVTLSGWYKAPKAVASGKFLVKIKYSDAANGKINLPIVTAADYVNVTNSVTLATANVTVIKLQVIHTSASGKVWVDDVSLTVGD